MRKGRWMGEMKRAVAVALIVTMLPFSSFTEIGGQTVYAATVSKEEAEFTTEGENVLSGNEAVEELPVLEFSEDKILEEDWNVGEELVMTGGNLNLNGHTLTVSSNLIHSGGRIIFNGGRLIVKGDYRRQTREKDEGGKYVYGNANQDSCLAMNSLEDYFLIEGDFYESSASYTSLGTGCIELKGNFCQSDEAAGALEGYGGQVLLLSGDEKQVIHCKDDRMARVTFRNLSVTNVSEEGVIFEGTPYVEEQFWSERESHIEGTIYWKGYVLSEKGYYGGDVTFVSSKEIRGFPYFEFGGDLYMPSFAWFYCPLKVDGNLYTNSFLYVYSELTVEGDVFIEDGSDIFGNH